MNKIIVVEKYLPSSLFWPNLVRKKKIINLSVEQVLRKYQGFEGVLIAFFPIQKSSMDLKKQINKCMELKNTNNRLAMCIISDFRTMPDLLKKRAIKVGYDVGVCEEETTIYSSIANEILFGNLSKLVVYKELLNENLLFPNKDLAKKYVALHNELSKQGRDVEDYHEMRVYEIWIINFAGD